MSALIRALDLCKWYAPQQRGLRGFAQAIRHGGKKIHTAPIPPQAFVALHPLSFTLGQGQVLGVVGRNGAGKSTLLQLLSGTLSPSAGKLEVAGRVAALLELGAGFNPEFSGLDNVYLNASILGLSRDEVRERLDAILGFADIGAFIHQPVKTYSSGMFVRLAFSVAVCVDPEVLIIDEALSVGDGPFARKSFQKIMDFRDAGQSILFCSHSLYQIEALCDQVIWLDQGKLMAYGPCPDVLAAYSQFIDRESNPGRAASAIKPASPEPLKAHAEASSLPASPAEALTSAPQANALTSAHHANALPLAANPRLESVRVWHQGKSLALGDEASRRLIMNFGTPCELALEIRWQMSPLEPAAHKTQGLRFELPTVAVALITGTGQCLAAVSTFEKPEAIAQDGLGRGVAKLVLSDLPLCKGQFRLDVLLVCSRGLQLYDQGVGVLHLDARSPAHEQGMIELAHRWEPMTSEANPTLALFYESMRSYCEELSAFRACGPTGMLNFGYWPQGTDTLHAAQQAFLGLLLDALLQHAPEQPGWDQGEALEFGCGLGGISFGVLKRLPGVGITGLDLSASQWALSQSNAKALGLESRFKGLLGDAMLVPLPDACMEFSLCVESSFHYPDKAAFLRENCRVLKPGGTALVADMTCSDPEKIQFRKGNYFASAADYRRWAQEAGFAVCEQRDLGSQIFRALLKHVLAFNAHQKAQGLGRDRRGRYWEMVLSNYVRIHEAGFMDYQLFVFQKPLHAPLR